MHRRALLRGKQRFVQACFSNPVNWGGLRAQGLVAALSPKGTHRVQKAALAFKWAYEPPGRARERSDASRVGWWRCWLSLEQRSPALGQAHLNLEAAEGNRYGEAVEAREETVRRHRSGPPGSADQAAPSLPAREESAHHCADGGLRGSCHAAKSDQQMPGLNWPISKPRGSEIQTSDFDLACKAARGRGRVSGLKLGHSLGSDTPQGSCRRLAAL